MDDKNKHTPEEAEEPEFTPEQKEAIVKHTTAIMRALGDPGLNDEEMAAFLNVRIICREHYGSRPGAHGRKAGGDSEDAFFRALILEYLYKVLPIAVARDFPANRIANACYLTYADVAHHLKRYQSGKTEPRQSMWRLGRDGKIQKYRGKI